MCLLAYRQRPDLKECVAKDRLFVRAPDKRVDSPVESLAENFHVWDSVVDGHCLVALQRRAAQTQSRRSKDQLKKKKPDCSFSRPVIADAVSAYWAFLYRFPIFNQYLKFMAKPLRGIFDLWIRCPRQAFAWSCLLIPPLVPMRPERCRSECLLQAQVPFDAHNENHSYCWHWPLLGMLSLNSGPCSRPD